MIEWCCVVVGKENFIRFIFKTESWKCLTLLITRFLILGWPKLSYMCTTYIFFWAIPGLFFLYFRLLNELTLKKCPMTGFELRTSDIGSDHPTNCATTTALWWLFHQLHTRVIPGSNPSPGKNETKHQSSLNCYDAFRYNTIQIQR